MGRHVPSRHYVPILKGTEITAPPDAYFHVGNNTFPIENWHRVTSTLPPESKITFSGMKGKVHVSFPAVQA